MLTEAEFETSDAAIWYEDQREGLGGDFLTELRAALNQIRQAPQSASLLDRLAPPE